MLEFEFEDIQSDLYEVSATITEEKAAELQEELETLESTAAIKSNFRQPSKFTIGEPLSRKLEPADQEVTAEIKAQLDKFDFYLVQLACSFQPAEGCRFHIATFEINLEANPSPPTPLAYDLQPDKVEDELKVNRKFALDPNFKLKILQQEIGLSGVPIKAELTKEYVTYTSRIVASGLQTSQASWQFARTKAREINGSYRLLMVVRKPKGSKVTGQMSLTASQEFLLPFGPVGPLPLTTSWRKQGKLVDDQLIELD
jgi:hypothetical protein